MHRLNLFFISGLFFLMIACQSLPALQTNTSLQNSKRTPAADLSAIRPGFVPLRALDPSKKTVCAMTLNSDNEILTFQRHLPADHFQFVELVNKEHGWLEEAVQAQVKCDILVVSGHFGGSFFGDKGSLSLNELENATCSKQGAGIFHSVKEVFLFGCNTLAGKDKDHRTPQEYVQVLIADGFSQAQAEQVAAFRYSPIGNTFGDRMSRVFAGVPKIYGFTSVGPTGQSVEPLLTKYLANKNYVEHLERNDRGPNTEFLTALKSKAIKQIEGTPFTKVDLIPRCILTDKNVGESKKLKLVDQLLTDPNKRLAHLSEIGEYLIQTKRTGANRALETEMATRWAADASLKQDMNKVLDDGLKGYPVLRLQMTDIGLYFGWLSSDEVKSISFEIVGKPFEKRLSNEEADMLISMGDDAGRFITFDMVKNSIRKSRTIHILGRIRAQDPQIHWALVDVMKTSRSAELRREATDSLGWIRLQDPRIHAELAKTLKNDPSGVVRKNAAASLGNIHTIDPKIHWDLVEAMKTDPDEGVRYDAIWALSNIKTSDPKIHEAFLHVMNTDSSPRNRRHAAESLKELRPKDPAIKKQLADWLQVNGHR